MSAASEQFPCTSWCTDDDRHSGYSLRGDQSCWGPQLKTVFSLDHYAPAIGAEIPLCATGISVFAYQGWYELPKVKLNVFRDSENPHLCVDSDFLLTPSEAIELANHLITVVGTLGGAR